MRYVALMWCTVLFTPVLYAHSDAYLDTVPAAHGGQLRMAGPFHIELVPNQGELMLYVTDHADNKVATAGAKATATVLSGKAKAQVNLTPAGDNSLKGSGSFTLDPEMKVVVSLTMPNQEAVQARFTPLKKAAAADAGGDADDPGPGHNHDHSH